MSHSRKIGAVVFDFDGTLAELRLDFGVMKEQVRLLAGEFLGHVEAPPLRVLEWLDVLGEEIQRRDPALFADFMHRAETVLQGMEVEAAQQGSLFAFTRPMLEGLRERGIRAAVITRNCDAAVRIVFPDVDVYCDVLLARDHVPRVKPDPDHLLRALERLACGTERALMVGDHPLDVETGRRAGVLTAGVSSGRMTLGDLARAGADWVAGDCPGIMDQLVRCGFL